MFRDNKEDILLDFSFISLIPSKINVVIFGAGRAGYIKAKSYFKKGYNVTVVSKEFDNIFKEFKGNIKLIKDGYSKKYLIDKHLVIIATDDKVINKTIRNDCDENFKIYLDTTSPKEGKFTTPVETECQNIKTAVSTNIGSPVTTKFLSSKIRETISEYDDFVKFVGVLRNQILEETKDRKLNLEIMNFINSDDFYYFYRLNKHRLILKLFWGDYFDFYYSN